jgi:hypothetical protein
MAVQRARERRPYERRIRSLNERRGHDHKLPNSRQRKQEAPSITRPVTLRVLKHKAKCSLFETANKKAAMMSEKRRKHVKADSDRTVFSMEQKPCVADAPKRRIQKEEEEN